MVKKGVLGFFLLLVVLFQRTTYVMPAGELWGGRILDLGGCDRTGLDWMNALFWSWFVSFYTCNFTSIDQ